MAGPTPVSALLHSSTMVIAGLYLIIQLNSLFVNSLDCAFHQLAYFIFINSIFWKFSSSFYLIVLISLFWSMFSGFIHWDIKSVIAFSTVSQLSYIFIVIPFSISVAAYHIVIHGLFKSILFMCSGIFIHNYSSFQLVYRISNISSFLSSWCSNFRQFNYSYVLVFSVCSIVLCVNLSKEFIIIISTLSISSSWFSVLIISSVIFSILYSIKLILYLV